MERQIPVLQKVVGLESTQVTKGKGEVSLIEKSRGLFSLAPIINGYFTELSLTSFCFIIKRQNDKIKNRRVCQ